MRNTIKKGIVMKKLQLLALSMLLSTSMVMMSKNTTRVKNVDGSVTTTTCKGNTCTIRENFKNRKKCTSNSCLRHQPRIEVQEVIPTTVVVEELPPLKTTRTSTIRTSDFPGTRSRKVTEYRTTRPTLSTTSDDVVTTTQTTTVVQD